MIAWQYHPAGDLDLTETQRWQSLKRECGLVSSVLHLGCWSVVRSYLALWHRLKVHGAENLPAEPPFVLAANHCSHLDTLALGASLPWQVCDRVFPIAAGDVFFAASWKSALASKLLNALPMWRRHCGPQALRQLRERLVGEPCGYILFPEGGRSRDGRLMPFRSGVGMLVAGTNVPVVPCRIDGCFLALPAGHCLPRPVSIRVTYGRPLSFANESNDRSGWEKISRTLRQSIELLAVTE